MPSTISAHFKSNSVTARSWQEGDQLHFEINIKGWVRRRSYHLCFVLKDDEFKRKLKSALMTSLDSSSYMKLKDNWITKIENLSWRMFGFDRTHGFVKKPDFPSLSYADEISLLKLGQSKSRPKTNITDVFFGTRKGDKYLLLRVGVYVSQGIGNGTGSVPDTAVIPMKLIEQIVREL